MPRKRPPTPHVRLPEYPRPTCLCKSAHIASRADTGGITRLATLCHESFNALLFSRKVRRLKLLLIELLYD